MQHSSLISKEATEKTCALYQKYQPLERSTEITEEQRGVYMCQWWDETQKILAREHIPKEGLKDVIAKSSVRLRDGFKELAFFLESNNVPLLIFSGGITDMIDEILLQRLGRRLANVTIVANTPIWNDDGILVDWRPDPPFHTLSKTGAGLLSHLADFKDEKLLKRITNDVLARHQAFVLGDTHGDAKMSNGFTNIETAIKCCFVRDGCTPSEFELYKSVFDVLVLNDGPMFPVLDLLQQMNA